MLVHVAGSGEFCPTHTTLKLLLLGVCDQMPVIFGIISQLSPAETAPVVAFRFISLKVRNTSSTVTQKKEQIDDGIQ